MYQRKGASRKQEPLEDAQRIKNKRATSGKDGRNVTKNSNKSCDSMGADDEG